MLRVSSIGFVAIIGALVVGCGNSSVSIDELEDEWTNSICEAQVACGVFPDVDSCKATIDTSGLAQLTASVEAGRADYDSNKANDCLDGLTGLIDDCTVITDPDAFDAAFDDCDAVFTGTVETGGSCVVDAECAGDAECEVPECPTECCVGTCVAGEPEPPAAPIGGDCSEASCVAGANCQTDEGTGARTCVADATEGQECSGFGSGTCATGLVCDAFSGTSTCKRPAASGETCDPSLGFGVLSCIRSDQWCDPSDTICKDRPRVGEACGGEVDNCIDHAYCSSDMVCVQRSGNGEACGGQQEIPCLQGYDCSEGGTCAPDVDDDPVCTI